jgi:hypothetical protein
VSRSPHVAAHELGSLFASWDSPLPSPTLRDAGWQFFPYPPLCALLGPDLGVLVTGSGSNGLQGRCGPARTAGIKGESPLVVPRCRKQPWRLPRCGWRFQFVDYGRDQSQQRRGWSPSLGPDDPRPGAGRPVGDRTPRPGAGRTRRKPGDPAGSQATPPEARRPRRKPGDPRLEPDDPVRGRATPPGAGRPRRGPGDPAGGRADPPTTRSLMRRGRRLRWRVVGRRTAGAAAVRGGRTPRPGRRA